MEPMPTHPNGTNWERVTSPAHRMSFEKPAPLHVLPLDKLEVYYSLLWKGREALGLSDQSTSQIIVFRKYVNYESRSHCRLMPLCVVRPQKIEYCLKHNALLIPSAESNVLNELCCKVYNHHLMYQLDSDRPGSGRKIIDFRVQDKVIVSKNSDVPIYVSGKEIGEDEQTGSPDQESPLLSQTERLMNGSAYIIQEVHTFSVLKCCWCFYKRLASCLPDNE